MIPTASSTRPWLVLPAALRPGPAWPRSLASSRYELTTEEPVAAQQHVGAGSRLERFRRMDAWSFGAVSAHPFQGWAPVGLLATLVVPRHNVKRWADRAHSSHRA